MDQISRPFQIALLLAVSFLGVWFVALRPKPVEEAPPPPAQPAQPPAKSSIPGPTGDALDTARSGAAQANADAAARPGRVDGASGAGAGVAPASGAAAAAARRPASDPLGAAPGQYAREVGSLMRYDGNGASMSGAVAFSFAAVTAQQVIRASAPTASASGAGAAPGRAERALAQRKTVVLLFYGRGSDDLAMRGELAKVNTRGGRVVALSAPVTTVAQFGALTSGVRVLEAPTTVVVGPGRQGRALAGYSDSTEIDQAVLSSARAR